MYLSYTEMEVTLWVVKVPTISLAGTYAMGSYIDLMCSTYPKETPDFKSYAVFVLDISY